MISNIPIYRAKSNERKNSYVEGFLIGLDEEIELCTIRTKEDYIGGEICYLHTLAIHFSDMLDSQGNKIFASLQEDGKGGDIISLENITKTAMWCSKTQAVMLNSKSTGLSILSLYKEDIKVIGIQE